MDHSVLRTALLSLALGTLFVTTAYAEDGVITGSDVNFRSGPGMNYEVTDCLEKGTVVTINDRSDADWICVRANGADGYVSSRYLSITAEATEETSSGEEAAVQEAAGTNGKINAMYVRFRSGPSSSATIIGQHNTGTAVTITGSSGDWTACTINGKSGYVFSQYVTPDTSSAAAEASTQDTAGEAGDTPATPETETYDVHKTGKVNAEKGYLRYGASSNYGIICTLATGTEIEITGRSGNWYTAIVNRSAGYIWTADITLTGEVSDSVTENSDSAAGDASAAAEDSATQSVASGETGTINASSVHFRTGASTSSSIQRTLSRGTEVVITGTEGDWVACTINGKTGYVFGKYVTRSSSVSGQQEQTTETQQAAPAETSASGDGYIRGNNVRFRSGASTSSDILGEYNYGTAMTITGISGDWTACTIDGKAGYVYSAYVATGKLEVYTSDGTDNANAASADNTDLGSQIAQYALGYVGTCYVWGGSDPSGFDCSGFVYYCYSQFGYTLHRVACDQAANDGRLVSNDELQPGDILCFYSGSDYIGHVGIYIGDGRFVHASSSTTGVIITELSGYYSSRGYIAKRIV